MLLRPCVNHNKAIRLVMIDRALTAKAPTKRINKHWSQKDLNHTNYERNYWWELMLIMMMDIYLRVLLISILWVPLASCELEIVASCSRIKYCCPIARLVAPYKYCCPIQNIVAPYQILLPHTILRLVFTSLRLLSRPQLQQ